ncbi:DUF262 domain-containing protein [Chloroflexales bacterium ZM16-3]|nr:DUF262 domain-containing protein [Chloroflexales bacterium ZM16-3]
MEAKRMSIATLLYQKMPFVVPKYQRAYAWEDEEIEDFINDILKLYTHRIDNPSSEKKHFFGGIVSINKEFYEVIDGQQRLATFMMSIALTIKSLGNIIADTHKSKDTDTKSKAEEYERETRRDYFQYRDLEARQDRLRLRLSLADLNFYEQLVLGNKPTPTRESHKRLRYAYATLQKRLFDSILKDTNLDYPKKLDRILTILNCLLQDCYVIHIASDNKNEAYQLFTTLNDRGKSLSTGDLLRARSLELLEGYDHLQPNTQQHWDSILAPRRQDIDHFLESYYPSHKGERASKRNVFDEFVAVFFSFVSPMSHKDALVIEQRVASMSIESDLFEKIKDGDWPYESPTASTWNKDRLFRLIRVLKHELCLPILMAATLHLDEKVFADIVGLIERFAFRYVTMVGAHIGPLADKYYKYAVKIRGGIFDFHELENELKILAQTNAQDGVFEANLSAKLRYSEKSSQQNRVIKHFLTTLEDYQEWLNTGASGHPRKKDQTKCFDLNQVTVEHIYPKNAATPIPDLVEHRHDLGNLTILGPENSSLGNKPFLSKTGEYGKSHISMTRALSNLPDWTIDSVDKRQKELIRQALKVYAF